MTHPNDTQLLDYLVSDETDSNWVEDHLETCQSCRNRVDEFVKIDLPLSLMVQNTAASTTTAAPPIQRPAIVKRHERYEFGQLIGRGGMAEVFFAKDKTLNRDVAIKIIGINLSDDERSLERFREEAQICSRLVHPGIVPIHDFGILDDGRPFIVMKFVEGETFKSLLQTRNPLHDDTSNWLNIFQRVCETMAFAHSSNVIHRDLKPMNIIVGEFGEVQVMDWGIAKILEKNPSRVLPDSVSVDATFIGSVDSTCTSVLGTPNYMSPEQAYGDNRTIDQRTDVFALGSILYEILMGRQVLNCKTPREAIRASRLADYGEALELLNEADVDEELKKLTSSCLSADADLRPANAGIVAETIRDYFSNQATKLRDIQRLQDQAEAKASMLNQRRWLTMALVSCLAIFLMSVTYKRMDAANRRNINDKAINSTIDQADKLMSRSWTVNSQIDDCVEEIELLIQKADMLLASPVSSDSKESYVELMERFAEFKSRTDIEKQFFEDAELASEEMDANFDGTHDAGEIVSPLFQQAFAGIGITPDTEVAEAAQLLRKHIPANRLGQAFEYLHEWTWLACFKTPKRVAPPETKMWLREMVVHVEHNSNRRDLWTWSTNKEFESIIEFSKSNKAIADPFTAMLTFDLLNSSHHTLSKCPQKKAAIEFLQKALEHFSDDLRLNFKQGLYWSNVVSYVHDTAEPLEKAIAQYRNCLAVSADHLPSVIRLAQSLSQSGNHIEAERRLAIRLSKHPNEARLHVNMAIQQLALENFELATTHAVKAFCLAGEILVDSYGNLGGVKIRKANYDWRRSGKSLAKILIYTNQIEDAEVLIQYLCMSDKKSFDAQICLLRYEIAKHKGDLARASQLLARVIRKTQTRWVSKKIKWEAELLALYLEAEDYENAFRLIQEPL